MTTRHRCTHTGTEHKLGPACGAKGTARMGGPPEGGRPPMAAIQRGPYACPKVPAEFDRRPPAGARGRPGARGRLVHTLDAFTACPAGPCRLRDRASIDNCQDCGYRQRR